ncbi:MAG: ubiquinone biosynthesis protein UbiA [Flavobacteriaceae bacterium]|nr:ubiquinone biosynthesis protein UbiA [Flavobacteriaceae bacterium]
MYFDSKKTLLKVLSLFSVVRIPNIFLIVLAQYLTSIFILAHQDNPYDVLTDTTLLIIVFCTVGAIASGYIANNFYDQEKDLINRPQKLMIDHIVSQKTKFWVYITLNFSVVFLSSFISIRAVAFFLSYIFFIWFYSHKIKKLPLIGNLTSALLSITPFFAILLYFKNYNALIFVFGFYLFLVLAIRELLKSLINIKGDLTLNYKTVPVLYGEFYTKKVVSILISINCLVSFILIYFFELRKMNIFFIGSSVYLIFIFFLLRKAKDQRDFNLIQNFLKLLIFIGVLSIVLLDPSLVLNKISF